jgi:gliding motility-associated-like protein
MLKWKNHTLIILILAFSGNSFAHNHRHYEFIPNKGQENASVNYTAKLNGGKLFVKDKSLLFHFVDNSFIAEQHRTQTKSAKTLKGHAYELTWINASKPTYAELKKTKHYYNYFKGNVSSKWAGGVYAFEELGMQELYPGISLKFETNEDEKLKYTYTISRGASPAQIIQEYSGIDQLKIGKNGNLLITTSLGVNQELAPIAWQYSSNKVKKMIPCKFKLIGKRVMYEFPQGYNEALELIIDPVLVMATSSGSFADNFGMTATYDNAGNLYSGGTCFDTGFPTTVGAWDVTSNPTFDGTGVGYGITDVVITKYSGDGTSLIYSTYLGGGTDLNGTETVHSLIVNANDELMCFGATSSTDFPTTVGAYNASHSGGSLIQFLYNGVYFKDGGTDIYVTKFNAAGSSLIGSTYIGGSANDGVNYKVTSGDYTTTASYDSLTSNYGDQFRGEIMIDAANNIYVTSTTRSSDFPTVLPFQPTKNGGSDAVVFKFNPTLTTLLFSTYLGGSSLDAGYSIKLDLSGNIFVAGGTTSADFPATVGSLYPTYQGGKADGYIAKLNPTASSMLACSYIGTSLFDQSMFVEIDKDDKVYLYGNTLGTATFPITAPYSNPNSGQYIVKMDNNLTAYEWSTLFGNGAGTVNISPSAFLVDVCGNIYISGWGGSVLAGSPPTTGMPTTSDALQPLPGHGYGFYISCFQRNMTGLLYATYFGGNVSQEHVDGGTSRFDKYGIVYQSVCAGCGGNDDFPQTPGAWSAVNNSSNCNNGVFKFDFEIAPVADFSTDIFAGCNPITINFINSSPVGLDFLWDFGNGDTTSVIFNPTVTYTDTGTFYVTLITEDSLCGLIDTAVKIINVYPSVTVTANSDIAMCAGAPVNLIADGGGTSQFFVWSNSLTFTDTLNSPLSDSTITVSVLSDTVFYVQTYNPYCNELDTVNIDVQELDPSITGVITSCAGDSIMLTAFNSTPETYTIDWSPDPQILSGDGTPVIIVNPALPVTYSVLFTSSAGCSATATYFVDTSSIGLAGINATATPSTIAVGETSQLVAVPSTGYTYVWTPSTFLNNPGIYNPIATPLVTTTYIVTISSGGCSRSDTVTIVVREFVCGDPYIYVPNAFTPNGDNNNDVLYVRGRNVTEVYFAVFERWGEKVFETKDMNIGWDGKVNGRDADPAVFDYYLKVRCADEQEFFQKGNITLIR